MLFVRYFVQKSEIFIDRSYAYDSIWHGMLSVPRVGYNSTVRILWNGSGERRYTITRTDEADPEQQLISDESPLGRALIGASPGETRTYRVGENIFSVRVLEIV